MKLEGSLININGMKLSQLSKYLPIKRDILLLQLIVTMIYLAHFDWS
jgi:hypothetical protein